MRPRVVLVVRVLYGLMLIVFFLMDLFGWQPPDVPPDARVLRDALFKAGYFMPIIHGVYLVSGICFTTNRFVSLAALVLFPISLNIVLYHSFLDPAMVPAALVVFLPNIFFMYEYRDAYRCLLRAKP
ncbi:MAG: hypothetical protein ACE5JX_14845 [Acidobacteriota bacterium]